MHAPLRPAGMTIRDRCPITTVGHDGIGMDACLPLAGMTPGGEDCGGRSRESLFCIIILVETGSVEARGRTKTARLFPSCPCERFIDKPHHGFRYRVTQSLFWLFVTSE